MKNLFKKQSRKKIPDEITARQVSFKVLKKKTIFEATDRRESTTNNCIQQTHSDAAKFLQRMESIGEVHLEFNNEDMHQDLDLIHRRKSRVSSSTRQHQSRKTLGRRSPGEEQFLSSKRDNGTKRERKQSQRHVITAPIHKLEKMDLHGGHDPRTRPRSGSSSNHYQNRDMAAAGKMTAVSQAFPKNTDSRPVRKAVSKRGSMDVCLGFEDSGSEVSNSKDVYSPPPRKRRSLDMTDAASEDIVKHDLHSMDVDPRIAALHTAAHKMHKQQFEDRRRMQQDPRNIGTIDNNIKPKSFMRSSRQTADADLMNRKRMLQKQVSMPEDAPRQMPQQHFIKQQSMRQFSKAEHEARQVQLLQRQQFTKQQVCESSRSELESRQMAAQRPQMMKQHSVKHNSISAQDPRQVLPKQKSFRKGSGPVPLTEAPGDMQFDEQYALQQSHKHDMKEQHRQDPNRRSLVQDTVQDLQAQFQQTANVWDEINSQQFDQMPQVSMQQSKNEARQVINTIDNQQQLPEGKINNMNIASRSRVFQQEQQQPRNNMKPDHISAKKSSSKERLMQRDQVPVKSMQNEQVLMRPDQISAIPIKKPSSGERLMQRDQAPVKLMQNEQVLIRPDQISAIPIKKPSSRDRLWRNHDQIPFQSMQNEQVLIKKRLQPPRILESTEQSLQKEQVRHQGQISNQLLRGSPTMQLQRHSNEKEQLQTTTAQSDKSNLNLVRNNSSREHDEWYQSELQMSRVPSDQMLRARNSRFHKMQKQQSVRTYQSNSSSESRGNDVRTEMIRNSRMTGQSTRTFESNSSSESRESARQSPQVSHHHAQNNKRDEIIEQMTIVKRRPTLKRSSMDTSLAIIQDL